MNGTKVTFKELCNLQHLLERAAVSIRRHKKKLFEILCLKDNSADQLKKNNCKNGFQSVL